MKNKILLYLFIFSVLTSIFIYVNDKKILESQTITIQNLELRLQKLDKKVHSGVKAEKFNLLENEKAITYFERQGFEANEIQQKVIDSLIDLNDASKDNPLVPYDGINGVMRINQVQLLNNKWLIANFTDGKYWGEILLSYDISGKENIHFENLKSVLYSE
ncbi:hypothetical protein [Zunongwangia sp.]|uniref:hypothetical protein n=1 Tax=Zunongwangia sp. TaxID=1965325 RepID=UPI003AA7E1D3